MGFKNTWHHKTNADNFRTSTQAINWDFISWINAEGLSGASHLIPEPSLAPQIKHMPQGQNSVHKESSAQSK